ncbi:SCNN1G [Bugula neritina]|uniref:SCNN1G n=1 Tax=Bugula neritina TaxID=10212 RepID=A0A7J7KFI8_BUGNE|nr:SCNN1G [Bugula neritina]
MLKAREFYSRPNVEGIANMSWFNNVGEAASEKTVLLNLTHTLANYTLTQLSGLSLTLFINQSAYVPALSTQAGVRIMLHRQGEVPLIAEDGFNLSPGTKSAVAVKYIEVSRQPGSMFSNCTHQMAPPQDGGLHEFYPGNYTQKACINTCLQKGIISTCGCASPFYRYPPTAEVCPPIVFDCVERRELQMFNDNSCQKSCPSPCWESQYQYTLSASQWPSNSYKPYLAKLLKERGSSILSALTDETVGLAQEFVKLEVFYDNLNYLQYSEKQSMTVEDLVGAIGGHLGLWIGMSILSFVEVIELIVDLLKVFAGAFSNNRVKNS